MLDATEPFIEAEKSFKKLRGSADLKILKKPSSRNPTTQKTRIIIMSTASNLQLSSGHRLIKYRLWANG